MRAFPQTPGTPGKVAEWSIAPDSKSGSRVSRDEGSNPSLSAICPVGSSCETALPHIEPAKEIALAKCSVEAGWVGASTLLHHRAAPLAALGA